MLIDMHVHEKEFSSCSRMSLSEAVTAARAVGLDGLCITDHESMSIREYAADFLGQHSFPVFIGIEVTTFEGDILAYGLNCLPERMLSSQDFLDFAWDQKAFCSCAHPFRAGYALSMGKILPGLSRLESIEVLNGGNSDGENRLAIRACRRLARVPLAGSDAHVPSAVGKYALHFPSPVCSEADLIQALRRATARPARKAAGGQYEIVDLSSI